MPRSRIHNIIEHGTQPGNVSSNTKYAKELLDEMSKYKHGEILALNVLVEKLRTFDEVVALQALNMLEYCAENGGSIFQLEIGRNRFLNEMAKMLSPKYDADKCPIAVKKRISIIFYEWSKLFSTQPKIYSAYVTLNNKGYIIVEAIKGNKKQREKSAIEDNGATKKLERLLRSNHPDDLVLANRLIKNMFEKEEHRTINIHNRKEKIQSIHDKIDLLRDTMTTYRLGNSNVELAVIKEIKTVCQDYHGDLNNTANNAIADKDPFLKDLMQLSEDLTNVLNEYDEFENNFNSKKMQNLMDLDDIFGPGISISPAKVEEKLELGEQELKQTKSHNTIDDDFLDLFCSRPTVDLINSHTTLPSDSAQSNNVVNFTNASTLPMGANDTATCPSSSLSTQQPKYSTATTSIDSLINSIDISSLQNSSNNYIPVLSTAPLASIDTIHNSGVFSQTKPCNPMDNIHIDMASMDIVKTIALTGSKLIFCLALAKLKPAVSYGYDSKLRFFIFNGMNMTTATITNISLTVSTDNYTKNELDHRVKLLPISQIALTPFNPMMPPSVFTAILVVHDVIPMINFDISYTHSEFGRVVETIPTSLNISE